MIDNFFVCTFKSPRILCRHSGRFSTKLSLLLIFSLVLCVPVTAKEFKLGFSAGHMLVNPKILDRIRCAFNYAGHSVDFIELPMARSLQLASRGVVDGDVGRVGSTFFAEKKILPIPTPILIENIWAYGRRELVVDTKQELESLRLVNILGIKYFDRYILDDTRVERASSLAAAFKMVAGKRGDYTLWTAHGDTQIGELGLTGKLKRILQTPVDQQAIYVSLNARFEAFVAELDLAFKQALDGDMCLPPKVSGPTNTPLPLKK